MIDDILWHIFKANKLDRIGPDFPFHHWRLLFKSTATKFCRSKFKFFGDRSEFRFGSYAVFCSHIYIGSDVVIRPQSMLFADSDASITIEDKVLIGSGIQIYVNNHKYSDSAQAIFDQGYSPSKSVVLKEGCWVGASVIILPGVTIGRNAVVGAGSVVTKNVADFSVVGGNPAVLLNR